MKKKIILFSAAGITGIALIVSALLWVSYRNLRNEIIPLCEEYIEYTEMFFPEDMITKPFEQRQDIVSQILVEKKKVYDQLFSKNVSDYVEAYELMEKIAQNAVDLKSVVVFADYDLKEFIRAKKAEIGRAHV